MVAERGVSTEAAHSSWLLDAADLLAEPDPGPTPWLVDGLIVDQAIVAVRRPLEDNQVVRTPRPLHRGRHRPARVRPARDPEPRPGHLRQRGVRPNGALASPRRALPRPRDRSRRAPGAPPPRCQHPHPTRRPRLAARARRRRRRTQRAPLRLRPARPHEVARARRERPDGHGRAHRVHPPPPRRDRSRRRVRPPHRPRRRQHARLAATSSPSGRHASPGHATASRRSSPSTANTARPKPARQLQYRIDWDDDTRSMRFDLVANRHRPSQPRKSASSTNSATTRTRPPPRSRRAFQTRKSDVLAALQRPRP